MTKQFKVKVKLKDLAEDFPSCQQLAEHLDGSLPATAFADAAPVANSGGFRREIGAHKCGAATNTSDGRPRPLAKE